MHQQIRNSFSYNIITKTTKYLDKIIEIFHEDIVKKDKTSSVFSYNSYIYFMFSKIAEKWTIFQRFLHTKASRSYFFGRIDILKIFFQKLELILLLIPFNYIFVDYLMRKIGFLYRFSSIWDELLLLLMYGIVIFRGFWQEEIKDYKIRIIDIAAIFFMLVGVGLLLIVSPNMSVGIEGYRAVYQHILWYFPVRVLLNDKNRIYALRSFAITGFFLGYHALYQYILKVPMPGNWVDSTETLTTRAFSIIGSPNILGALFVCLIPLVIAIIYYDENKTFRVISFISLFPMIIGLLVTFARQAYLAIFGAFMIFFILFYPSIIKYLIILVGIVMKVSPSVANRILYLFTPTYFLKSARGGRLLRYAYAIEEWRKSPIFGNGLGRFGGAVATNNKLTPFYVDSYYLKTLGETGLVGLISMIITFLYTLIYTRKVMIYQKSKKDMFMIAGIFIGILGLLLQNIVENVFEVPMMIVMFWSLVAIVTTYE